MMAFFLGALACVMAVAAGAPWWTLGAAGLFAIPGRPGPVAGTMALLVLLPFALGPWWTSLLLACAGGLAMAAVLRRAGGRIPWVALPWALFGLLVAVFLVPLLPPAGVWADSDLALRLRILVLAVVAILLGAFTYLPRYRNPPGAPGPGVPGAPVAGPPGGGGKTGGRDETR